MPAFGPDADDAGPGAGRGRRRTARPRRTPPTTAAADPTLGTLHGPQLVGFQGYGCASCHVWNGKLLASPDPGATGPDLTRTAGRIRRDWFDRFLENPLRVPPRHADAGDLPARQAGDAGRRPRRRPGEAEGRPVGVPRHGQGRPRPDAAAAAADRRRRRPASRCWSRRSRSACPTASVVESICVLTGRPRPARLRPRRGRAAQLLHRRPDPAERAGAHPPVPRVRDGRPTSPRSRRCNSARRVARPSARCSATTAWPTGSASAGSSASRPWSTSRTARLNGRRLERELR